MKAATTTFTFKNLLRHYAQQALTPQRVEVKLGHRRKSHDGLSAALVLKVEILTIPSYQTDPSRLVSCASGWTDHPVGHVVDVHVYPGPVVNVFPEQTKVGGTVFP